MNRSYDLVVLGAGPAGESAWSITCASRHVGFRSAWPRGVDLYPKSAPSMKPCWGIVASYGTSMDTPPYRGGGRPPNGNGNPLETT